MLSLIRRGTLYIGALIDAEALPTCLADGLRRIDARDVNIQGHRVVFTGGMFRAVYNWNALVAFESGVLTVDPLARKVHYSLNCRQLVVLATAMVSLMTIFILFSSVWQALLAMPLMWLWLVGGNLVIGICRFESFVSRTIASSPHIRLPSPSS